MRRSVAWLGRLVLAALVTVGCHPAAPPPPVASKMTQPPAPPPSAARRFDYPESPRGNVVDVLHGVTVPDPYRWLEDSSSPQTQSWIAAQNRLTRGFLDGLPRRDQLRARLRELWDYERYELPFERGGRYFYYHNRGLQNQAVLFWLTSLGAEPKLLLDPNALSTDGTVALAHVEASDDGKLIAYALARGGSDWNEWRVRRVDDGQDLPDVLLWSKFSSVAWRKDNSGFYYSAYDAPAPGVALSQVNLFNKLYFHRLGQPQSQDTLVYQRPDKSKWSFNASATRDGRYVIITASEGTDRKNAVLYLDLSRPQPAPVELVPNIEADYSLIGSRGSTFWFQTDLHAPRGRIISVDVAKPEPQFVDLVPEQAETLRQVERVGGKFFANYLKDAHSELRVFDDHGALDHIVPLPGLGTVWLAEGNEGRSQTFFSYESFHDPRRS
ncbi:MAG TPA: hypothetical protein VEQ59_19380, partial [Polyangiaceae bacterium]|nr:hypothetical protein [Polyangiaceae bacterium]